jgi:hypothetical protein
VKSQSRLARLAVAGCLVLAGTGASVVAATPAAAAVVGATTAAAAGTVSANAVATCPAGEFLSGAGGSIVNGNGDVTLTDVIPDLATQSVTVWGHSNPGAVPGAYTVVAQAICVPGAVPANYQLITSASANNPVPLKNQAVLCPTGTNLLGLGAELLNADGAVFYQRIEPNAALTGGAVTAGASGGFAGPWQVNAYAICATLPAALTGTLVSATGASNSVDLKAQASGVCPAGALTTGVGATVAASATGNVLISALTANAAQDNAGAGAVEDGLYLPPWDLTSHNICWGP